MNPELVRNAWLELTPVRRWATPFVVALITALVVMGFLVNDPGRLLDALSITGLVLFALLMASGAMRAMTSVSIELQSNTWDMQRLSQHQPWHFMLGKLFGSTIFHWYAGVMALGVFVLGRLPTVPLPLLLLDVVSLVLGALWLQALGLLSNLMGAKQARFSRRPSMGTMGQALGLVPVLILLGVQFPAIFTFITGEGGWVSVHWWWSMPARIFVPFSLAMFLGWTLAGAHRLVRSELQEPVGPLPWLGYLGFMTLYLLPFTTSPELTRAVDVPVATMATGLLVFGATLPFLALGDRLDSVRLRSLAAAWRRRDWATLNQQLPLWTFTMACYGTWLAVTGVLAIVSGNHDMALLFGLAAACGLMVLRDIALMLAVYLSPRTARDPAMVAMFYLGLLYVALPAAAAALGETGIPLLSLLIPVVAIMDGSHLLPSGVAGFVWGLPAVAIATSLATPRLKRALKSGTD
jgi:hypothetical protein